jgi:hypothetical protein
MRGGASPKLWGLAPNPQRFLKKKKKNLKFYPLNIFFIFFSFAFQFFFFFNFVPPNLKYGPRLCLYK